RGATRDAFVGAFKGHAAEACPTDARSQRFSLGPQPWANPKSIARVIGKCSLDVYPWQVDNPMWNARYRHPYLFLTASQRSGTVSCEYDIINAAASVSRL